MAEKDLDRFAVIIQGFIRSHRDTKRKRLVAKPILWLARHMGKSEHTVRDYLYVPSTMNLATRALLKQLLREKLISGDSLDVILKLIDSIPERKS